MEVIPDIYKLSGIWTRQTWDPMYYLLASEGELTLIDDGCSRPKNGKILKKDLQLGFSPLRADQYHH